MGLLDYFRQQFQEPTQDDIDKLRAQIQALKRGDNGYGLLGPNDEQLAALRQQRGIPQAEAPSPWVSVGRGVTDLWEPVKQAYLNMADPTQAAAYRQQRAENERLYDRGMQWANASTTYMPGTDIWRTQGQQVPLLLGAAMGPTGPATSFPATMIGLQGTQNLYDLLNTLRKQFGVGE